MEEDEPALRGLAKECRGVKEAIRYYALHAVSEGQSVPLVAKIFCVSEA